MIILNAEFKNFRLLKDLKIDFANDKNKNLTVIRAANESGKTTMLNALQWCFFDEDGLPEKGKNYRISPIDLLVDDDSSIDISVSIDFSIINKGIEKKYKLLRSTNERVQSESFIRQKSNICFTSFCHSRTITET